MISRLLKVNSSLTEVKYYLKCCFISFPLTILNSIWAIIDESEVSILASGLKHSLSLTGLCMCLIQFILPFTNFLFKWNVTRGLIGDSGTSALSEALKVNSSLTDLSLQVCFLFLKWQCDSSPVYAFCEKQNWWSRSTLIIRVTERQFNYH